MSDTIERQAATIGTIAEQSSVHQRGGATKEFSTDTTVGRARELHDAGYREMPDQASASADKSFSSDYSGLSKAAEDLAASRQPGGQLVSRQYLDGEGAPADEREAVTLRRAAGDLNEARRSDSAAIENARVREIASEIDELREHADLADNTPIDDADPARSDAPPAQSVEDVAPDDASGDGQLDPIVQEALKHPQVRQAIEEEIGKAEAARHDYDIALDAVGGMLREVVFAQFPELKSDTAKQFEAALVQLSQRDPVRYGQARALADRLSAVQAAQLLQQQQRDATQRREFAVYAKAEDARFEAMIKNEKPEVIQKVANEIIGYAAELGVPREQFLQLCTTEPIMRNAAFQKMMFDAASYRLLQRARNEVAKKVVPPVQRPGVAADARSALREGDIRALSAKFASNPSVKSAADVLAAQRRARM